MDDAVRSRERRTLPKAKDGAGEGGGGGGGIGRSGGGVWVKNKL